MVVQQPGGAQAGHQLVDLIVDPLADHAAARVGIALGFAFHVLVAQRGGQQQLVEADVIHHPGGKGVRFLDAVIAAGGLDVAAAHQAAVLLLEHLDRLVAVHFVLMEAHAGDQIVAHRAPFKAVGQLGLYAFGGVLAVVVLETHVGHVLVAVQDRLGVGVAVVGVLDQVTDALAAGAGHLEPVALELVAVDGGFRLVSLPSTR